MHVWKSYSTKLQDPRWQRKRLTVLKRDKWTCQQCGAKDRPLHVHHKRYRRNPWESRLDELATYCRDCHADAHPEKWWLKTPPPEHKWEPESPTATPEEGRKFFSDLKKLIQSQGGEK